LKNEKSVYIRANSSTNIKNIEQEKYVSNCNRKNTKQKKYILKSLLDQYWTIRCSS
jgi:hypothetical protein